MGVTEWGMSDVVGPIAMGSTGGIRNQGPTYSSKTFSQVDNEVMKLVNNAYALGAQLLKDNKQVLDDVAAALLEKEAINAVEFQQILNKYDIKPKAFTEMPKDALEAAGFIDTISAVPEAIPEEVTPAAFQRILHRAGLDETTSI